MIHIRKLFCSWCLLVSSTAVLFSTGIIFSKSNKLHFSQVQWILILKCVTLLAGLRALSFPISLLLFLVLLYVNIIITVAACSLQRWKPTFKSQSCYANCVIWLCWWWLRWWDGSVDEIQIMLYWKLQVISMRLNFTIHCSLHISRLARRIVVVDVGSKRASSVMEDEVEGRIVWREFIKFVSLPFVWFWLKVLLREKQQQL